MLLCVIELRLVIVIWFVMFAYGFVFVCRCVLIVELYCCCCVYVVDIHYGLNRGMKEFKLL